MRLNARSGLGVRISTRNAHNLCVNGKQKVVLVVGVTNVVVVAHVKGNNLVGSY